MKISKYIDIPLKSLIIFVVLIYSSCDSSTEPKTIHGCIDSQACNYNPSATLDNNSCEYLDNCDVCDNDPSNDCGQDCNDEWGGTATLDDCGFCSGGSTGFEPNSDELGCGCFNPGPLAYCFDGDDDSQGSIGSDIEYCLQDLPDGWVFDCTDEDDACMSNIYDCFGDCSGIAFIDYCGVCSGGNTGIIANSDIDCAGVCYGTYQLDNCGICDDDLNNDCIQDCYGEWGGEAFLDDCNVCSGGSTGHIANSDQDCTGECFGNSVEDCTGLCNGFALVDDCGVCDDNSENDNSEMDCANECFGTAYINICENCVGGNTGLNDNNCTVTDIDGNVYSTIIIGNQEWMAENLKVTHYQNGDGIGSISWYGWDWNLVETYGYLYNWYAVDDGRGICSEGWHVPSDEEWMELEIYLGMSQSWAEFNGNAGVGLRGTDEGNKLKESGTSHWIYGSGATNESGFTALPGGWRHQGGGFQSEGVGGRFWTNSNHNTNAWARKLHGLYSTIDRFYEHPESGYSIRCVKDSD